MSRRKYILGTIEKIYRSFGFTPLETPAMENMETLTGKYGSEGDQLLFRILNSGDFMKNVPENLRDAREISRIVADKGLRYDLTVPLARFVSMNRHDLTLPYKRYQMQPVWRADRPQKGRYREFWQCDADVLGSDSLLCEADFIRIYNEVFSSLGLQNTEIRISHRKLLEAIADIAGLNDRFRLLTVLIDKTDKIGTEGVSRELQALDLSADRINLITGTLVKKNLSHETLDSCLAAYHNHEKAAEAIGDLKEMLKYYTGPTDRIFLDGSLARGLDYYTGCIFEAVATGSGIGSISGGGRYDDLTSAFGLKEKVPGIGISFGIDRIYDAMDALNLFPDELQTFSDVLFCPMDEDALVYCLPLADMLRTAGMRTEVYPKPVKIGKQLDYANQKHIRYAVIVGENEMKMNQVLLKDLQNGNQITIDKQLITKSIS